jgi:uncharacterized protein YndB with AHSA1/START domain
MKFDITSERIYPYPPETVWRALVDPHALGTWLMKTDFLPEEGRSFQMWCDNSDGGTDRYLCKVLEMEAPKRMLWEWALDGRKSEGATYVEFVIDDVADGTRLTVRHRGDRDATTIESFKQGWPTKLDQLGAALHQRTPTDP